MNFIITMECDKGCPYCFASTARNKEEKESMIMSFETYTELLDKVGEGDNIKLLGGEPTMHPEFEKFFDEALSRDKPVTLISNFLFGDDILKIIVDRLNTREFAFLINSTDLDKKDRMERFSKNYNTIYKALYQYDAEEQMSIGLTFEQQKDWKYYIDYLDLLKDKLANIESLRLSIPFPSHKKEEFFFINNKDFGKKFLYTIKWALENNITPRLDCVIYPCIFENKEEWKVVKKFMANVRTTCDGCPNDVFPDKTASFCYPIKENIKIDTSKYENSNQISDDMMLRHRVLSSHTQLPEACVDCTFKKAGMCPGPCLAFYDLSSTTLGVNI